MSTITVESIKAQLDDDLNINNELLMKKVYSDEIQLNKYCRTLTKVKGKFPQYHSVMTHVVQGFKPEWQELGKMEIKGKVLQNFHQKINLPIIPADLISTWFGRLRIEGKTPEEQPITSIIREDLAAKVIDDLSQLSVTAVYDALNADGQFGASLDGIVQVVANAQAHATHKPYTIPLSAITSVNVLDEMKKFERSLPKKVRKKVKYIFCSENVKLMYGDAFEEAHQGSTVYSDDRKYKTPTYKYELVGFDDFPDDLIFATTEGNMLKLVDVFENAPAVVMTQILDYKLKIFMEFHLGYDFAINELVFVANFDGITPEGLQDNARNALYYPEQNLPTV